MSSRLDGGVANKFVEGAYPPGEGCETKLQHSIGQLWLRLDMFCQFVCAVVGVNVC